LSGHQTPKFVDPSVGLEQENGMSRFQSLDTVLAHDENFREFFSILASGMPNPSSTSTDAGSADPTATAPAAQSNSHAPNVGTTTSWNFQGTKWTVANQRNIVAIAPANLTDKTIDLEALLQTAAARGLIPGNK
jgi:hypothetical protein